MKQEKQWVVKCDQGYLVSLDSGDDIGKPTFSPDKTKALKLSLDTVVNCFEHWEREELPE